MKLPIYFIFLVFFVLFESFSFGNAGDLNILCQKIEGAYISQQVCFEVFGRDPRSSTANLSELAIIIIDIVEANTTSVKAKLDRHLKKASNPKFKSLLEACERDYENGIPNLNRVKNYVMIKNYPAAVKALDEFTGTAPQRCINEFAGIKEFGNPIGDNSGALIDLSDIARAFFTTIGP